MLAVQCLGLGMMLMGESVALPLLSTSLLSLAPRLALKALPKPVLTPGVLCRIRWLLGEQGGHPSVGSIRMFMAGVLEF